MFPHFGLALHSNAIKEKLLIVDLGNQQIYIMVVGGGGVLV
jgi:hypothetical protein